MSDHSAATRRYAFLTPGSSAASARRSHSRALTLCSCTLDGISSDLRKHSLCDRLNPWQADWFHSCDGENVACAVGPLLSLGRLRPGRGQLSNSAQPEVTASGSAALWRRIGGTEPVAGSFSSCRA